MQTVQLYIGSNNNTGVLELNKIEKILASNHEGFTIQQAVGYWLGKKESTAVVTITDHKQVINNTVKLLKTELEQDAIAVMPVQSMVFA